MKLICMTLSIHLCLSLASFAQVSNDAHSPKELGKMVFSALQNYELSLYQDLIALESDCALIVQHLSDTIKEHERKELAKSAAACETNSMKVFSDAVNTIYTHQIDLLQTSIIEIKYEVKTDRTIESTDIHMHLRYMDKPFLLIVHECVKAERWVIVGGIEVIFESNHDK